MDPSSPAHRRGTNSYQHLASRSQVNEASSLTPAPRMQRLAALGSQCPHRHINLNAKWRTSMIATKDLKAWSPDAGLISEIKDQFSRAIGSYRANPDLISEHANLEESIHSASLRTGPFWSSFRTPRTQYQAERGRCRRERRASRDRPRYVNRALYCANAGRPFSKNGLAALTLAYLSGKRGDEIGRFGLGFKSVLAVSDAPQIFSRSVSLD